MFAGFSAQLSAAMAQVQEALKDAKAPAKREAALHLVHALSNQDAAATEPFAVPLMPSLLERCSDKVCLCPWPAPANQIRARRPVCRTFVQQLYSILHCPTVHGPQTYGVYSVSSFMSCRWRPCARPPRRPARL